MPVGGVPFFDASVFGTPQSSTRSVPRSLTMEDAPGSKKTEPLRSRPLTPDPGNRPSFARSTQSRRSFLAGTPVHPTTPVPFDPDGDTTEDDEESLKTRKSKMTAKSLFKKKLWRKSKPPPPPEEVPAFLKFELPNPMPLKMPDNRPRRSMGSVGSGGNPMPLDNNIPAIVGGGPYSAGSGASQSQPSGLFDTVRANAAPSISDAASVAESDILGPVGMRPDSCISGSARGPRSVISSLYMPVDARSVTDVGQGDDDDLVSFTGDVWPVPPSRNGQEGVHSTAASNTSSTLGAKRATAPVLGDFRSGLPANRQKKMVAQQSLKNGFSPPLINEDDPNNAIAHLRQVLALPPEQQARLRNGAHTGYRPTRVEDDDDGQNEAYAKSTRWAEVTAAYPGAPAGSPTAASTPAASGLVRALPGSPANTTFTSITTSSGKSTHPTQAAYLRYVDDNASTSAASIKTRASRALGLDEEVAGLTDSSAPQQGRLNSAPAMKLPLFPCTNEEVLPVTVYRGPLLRHLPMQSSTSSKLFSSKARCWRQTFCALTQIDDDTYHLHCFEPQPLDPVWPEAGRLGLRASSIVCVLGDGLDGEPIVLKVTGAEMGGAISSLDPIPAKQAPRPIGAPKRRGPYGGATEAVWLFALTGLPQLKAWMNMLKGIVGDLKDKEADLRAARPPPDVEEQRIPALGRFLEPSSPMSTRSPSRAVVLSHRPDGQSHGERSFRSTTRGRPSTSEGLGGSPAQAPRVGSLARSHSSRVPQTGPYPHAFNLDLMPDEDSTSRSRAPSSTSSRGKTKTRPRSRSTSATQNQRPGGGILLAASAPRHQIFFNDDDLEPGPGPSLLPRSPSSSNGSPDASIPGWNSSRLSGCDYVATSPALTTPTSAGWSNDSASIKSSNGSTTSSTMLRRNYLAATQIPPAGPPPSGPLPPLPAVPPSPPIVGVSPKGLTAVPASPKPKRRILDVFEEAKSELDLFPAPPPLLVKTSEPKIRFAA